MSTYRSLISYWLILKIFRSNSIQSPTCIPAILFPYSNFLKTTSPFSIFFKTTSRDDDETISRKDYLRTIFHLASSSIFQKPLSRRRLYPFVDVSIRQSLAFDQLCKIDRRGGRRSLSLTDIRQRDWLNGITCRPLRPAPARMQRPGVDVTRIGETRSTAHANAPATKIWNVNWSNVCNTGTPTGISWRFNSARSDVPRVRDDFDAGRRGGRRVCVCVCGERVGGLGSIRTCIARCEPCLQGKRTMGEINL